MVALGSPPQGSGIDRAGSPQRPLSYLCEKGNNVTNIESEVSVRQVLSGAFETNVMVGGRGDAVIFLHSEHGWQWSPLLEELAKSFTVYAPEILAKEESLAERDDVLDLLT